MRQLGWTLIQSGWCPYKQRRLEQKKRHQDACTQRKGHVGTQQEDGHLQAKKRDLRRNQTANTLILNFQAPEMWEINFYV